MVLWMPFWIFKDDYNCDGNNNGYGSNGDSAGLSGNLVSWTFDVNNNCKINDKDNDDSNGNGNDEEVL